MKLMHVDSSAKRETSNSRALSKYFVELLQGRIDDLQVDYLDLALEAPPHVSAEFARATYTPAEQRTPAMSATLADSDALCQRLLQADALLFAMPMYNWSMPSSFKAFIDAIVRAGVTYVADEQGNLIGQLSRQKVLFLTTRGADLGAGSPYAHMDALTPSLRAAFGFIGVAAPQFVDAQPLQFADPEARAAGLARARWELERVAAQWAGSLVRSEGVPA